MGSRYSGWITRAGRPVGLTITVLAFALAFDAVPAAAAPRLLAAEHRLRAALEEDLQHDPTMPGEALAVSSPRVSLALAVGQADTALGTPLEPDTPFRIASVTKTFVAAAVLRLVERKQIALDDPISRYLSPASLATLRAGRYDAERITVRQLLSHTAGLYDYATDPAYDRITSTDPSHQWTPGEQLRFAVEHGHRLAEPGDEFHYADTGYVLLGEIIEGVTGERLSVAVRSLLHFEQLGLTDTYWEQLEPPPSGSAPHAHQYFGAWDSVALDASHDLYGGGGLVSTVADLATFFGALFHGDVFEHRGTLDAMTRPSSAGSRDGAALGLFAETIAGERCFSHPGYWGTSATYCPRLHLAFARTTNQADDGQFDYGRLERTVVDVVQQAKAKDADADATG